MEFVDLTAENLAGEHLCCIIRSKTAHPGVEAKRRWLAERLPEGHVFRKLNAKETAFVEYAPLEKAWIPVIGENYLYMYCLWVTGANVKGKGIGRALMESCIADAKAQGKSGICMLGAKKQKAWLSDQAFAAKFGFVPVDETENGYVLLALSFDGTVPRFAESAKRMQIDEKELTVFYDVQCPFIVPNIEKLRAWCAEKGVPAHFVQVDSLEAAKTLPCVFNNWAVFYRGQFETANLLNAASLEKIIRRG